MMNWRKLRWCGWRSPHEFLEEADMEHIVQASPVVDPSRKQLD
jgi:hypothetical protein